MAEPSSPKAQRSGPADTPPLSPKRVGNPTFVASATPGAVYDKAVVRKPEVWTTLVAGRVTAWEMLERNWMAAGYPPLGGVLQAAGWQVISAVYDAVEGFITPEAAKAQRDAVLAQLSGLDVSADFGPGAAEALSAMLYKAAAVGLPGPDAVPHNPTWESQKQFDAIARAAHNAPRGQALQHFVRVTQNNAMLGPLLHGGDEIWPAASLLIARAETSIALQVWSYYRRSEAAKHVMAGLKAVLLRQTQRRLRGTLVRPIEVTLLTGCLDEDLGLEHHTGGLSAHQAQTSAPFHTAHYCIFPFPVDPELMHVRVLTQKRDARGNDRSKTLIIDDTFALVSTANIQGNHHGVSCDGVPLHDLGSVWRGDVVPYSLVAQLRRNIAGAHVLADNVHEGSWHTDALETALAENPAAHTPLPLRPADAATWADKAAWLLRALECSASLEAGLGHAANLATSRIITLTQAAHTQMFASNRRTAHQRGILAALAEAQHCIDINHSNVSAPVVVQALKAALVRGVDISLMAAEGDSDVVSRQAARRRKHIFDILAAYKARVQAKGQVRMRWQRHAYFGHTFRNSHAKAMFIDGHIAIIGTVNLDTAAWRHAGELSLVLHDPAVVARLWRALFIGFWDAARRKLDAAETQGFGDGDNGDDDSLDVTNEAAFEGAESTELSGAPPGQPQQVTMASLASARAPGRFIDVLFHQALVSADVADKSAYLSAFNQYFAPRISTEEAALERLAVKHIRLSLPADACFAFNIRRNVAHEPRADYASSYVIADMLVDREEGLRAYLLQPHDKAKTTPGVVGRHIIVYEGTTVRKDAVRQLTQHPTGRRAATDPRGLGYKAFAASRVRLLAWSHAARAQHAALTLLGFSLGGVQAARHWHALSAEARADTRLITFAMPGLDRMTAEQMAGPDADANICHFRVHLDPFSKVGQSRAPGRIVRYAGRRPYPSLANHTWAYLSEREMDGLPLALQFDTGHDDDPLSPRLDRFRRFWGLFRPAR